MVKVQRKTIAECATVISGVLEQKKSNNNTVEFVAVMPNQITPDGFGDDYGKIQRNPEGLLPYLMPGDIIIKRLNPDSAIVFSDTSVKALPSANLFVIRPETNLLDPCYLAFILESSKVINRISQRSGIGTAVSAVTASQIENCEIPLPSLEQQKKIGTLWECIKKQKRLLQGLITENNRLLQSISEKLYQLI